MSLVTGVIVPLPGCLALRLAQRHDPDRQGGEPDGRDLLPAHVPVHAPGGHAAVVADHQLVHPDAAAGRAAHHLPGVQGPPARQRPVT